MSKKKTLLTILAVVLVCCIAVTGTLAYLKADTMETPVKNTFVADGDGVMGVITLKEHEAVRGEDGNYSLNLNKEVTSNEYKLLPSTNVPKDPYITLVEKSTVKAYLYVEVVNGLGDKGVSYAMDDNWTLVSGVTGTKGGAVYVYNNIIDETYQGNTINIIKDKTIVVADTLSFTAGEKVSLDFYGYLAQASIGTPAAAFTTCFLSK